MTKVVIYRGTTNLGDAIQTAALSRLLPEPLLGIYRDALSAFAAPQSTDEKPLVVNGWLGDMAPSSSDTNAFFAGVFLGGHPAEHLDWIARSSLRKVGARDPFTQRLLAHYGLGSQLVGCATLTLPRYQGPRRGRISVDLRVPDSLSLTNLIAARMPWEQQWAMAIARIDALRNASVVFTSRLHIVLPCLAMGTPVVLPRIAVERAPYPARFSILTHLGFRFDEPNTIDVEPLAVRFRQFLSEALEHEIVPHDFAMPRPIHQDLAASAPERPSATGLSNAAHAITERGPRLRLAQASELLRRGDAAGAAVACRRLLAQSPKDVHGLHLLGLALLGLGKPEEALESLKQAAAIAPGHTELGVDIAAALGRLGRHAEAAAACQIVTQNAPRDSTAWHNLGIARELTGDLPGAADAYRAALEIQPNWGLVWGRLGGVLRRLGIFHSAETAYRTALRDVPEEPAVWSGLATTLEESGDARSAIVCHQQVAALRPATAFAHSNLLVAMHYLDAVTQQELFAEHLRWTELHGRVLRMPEMDARLPSRTTGRRLRVGYVSPDYCEYPAPRFFEPLLAHHNRTEFEIVCYNDLPTARADHVTVRCRKYGHTWRDTFGLSDDQVGQMVQADRIDVLVDLAGHMSNPRLTLFAHRAAPVQVSYIGYPSTTGLSTMDYRITDSLHDPPGLTEQWHTEKLIRLDPCCWCYRPDDDAPTVTPLPALSVGGVTFGVFNRPAKWSPTAIALWSRVLDAVPGSRLMALVAAGAETDPGLLRLFARHGIEGKRLVLVGRRSRAEYLRLWNQVDIALDTYPYHGMTTTCDGLWMGVPTVTLAGAAHVSRVGVSLMTAVGLESMIAQAQACFVAAAVSAASDLQQLSMLRSTLRSRMRSSPLCDAPGLTRRIENAFRTCWATWLGGRVCK